jgi:hypothetical protein
MTYADVDRKHLILKGQFEAGLIGRNDFDDALRALMVQDEQGRWWAKARDSGQWHVYDAARQTWIAASPPAYTPLSSPVASPQKRPSADEQSYISPTVEPFGATPYGGDTTAFGATQPSTAYGAYSQPELSPGLKVLFYILSFLVPIFGLVLYFIYRGKPAPEDRIAANRFITLSLVSFGLACLCSSTIPLMLTSL